MIVLILSLGVFCLYVILGFFCFLFFKERGTECVIAFSSVMVGVS